MLNAEYWESVFSKTSSDKFDYLNEACPAIINVMFRTVSSLFSSIGCIVSLRSITR